jgi:hypothetical protein
MITAQEFALLKEGSTVEVRGNFGSGPKELVTVVGTDSDIKNGIPGIDYDTDSGLAHWAYINQIDRVVAY